MLFSFDKLGPGDMQGFCYADLMPGIPVIFTYSKFLSMLRAFFSQLGIDASEYAVHFLGVEGPLLLIKLVYLRT